MKKLITYLISIFKKERHIAQCYECGKQLTKNDEFVIDPFYTTEARRLKNAFNAHPLKDTYCTSCKEFLKEANRIVDRDW